VGAVEAALARLGVMAFLEVMAQTVVLA
jgi:hypothetical protein